MLRRRDHDASRLLDLDIFSAEREPGRESAFLIVLDLGHVLLDSSSFGTSGAPWSPKRAVNRPEAAALLHDVATVKQLICRPSVGAIALRGLPENRGVPGSSPGLAIGRSACK
jgi:hypothetical protein